MWKDHSNLQNLQATSWCILQRTTQNRSSSNLHVIEITVNQEYLLSSYNLTMSKLIYPEYKKSYIIFLQQFMKVSTLYQVTTKGNEVHKHTKIWCRLSFIPGYYKKETKSDAVLQLYLLCLLDSTDLAHVLRDFHWIVSQMIPMYI